MAKKRKKKGKGGVVAVLICGVVAAGYFLRDCIPGFGTGGGAGSGTESAEDSETTETDTPPGEKGTVAVVVTGETCELGGESVPCADACESIKADSTPESARVEVDGTNGATDAVETLRSCLDEAGFTVDTKSE